MSTTKTRSNIAILQERLQGIKDREGIIGYILRGSTSASIDIKDPTKIINYAILSAAAFEAAQNLAAAFETGEVDNMIMESEDTKTLFTEINNHCLSIFMDKNVDHDKLCKDLNL